MKKENNIIYFGFIESNDRKKSSGFGGILCDDCRRLLDKLLKVLGYFNHKRTKDILKIQFIDNVFIQPYNSDYHIKIKKIIVEK